MKTAEELHDFIQNCHSELSAESMCRLLVIVEQLNDRCRVLESRLTVAEAKLDAGGPVKHHADKSNL